MRNVRVVAFTGQEKERQSTYEGYPIEVSPSKPYRQATRTGGNDPRYDSYMVIPAQDVTKIPAEKAVSKAIYEASISADQNGVSSDSNDFPDFEEIQEAEGTGALTEKWMEVVYQLARNTLSFFVSRSYASNDDLPLSVEEILYISSALTISLALIVLHEMGKGIWYLKKLPTAPPLLRTLLQTIMALMIFLYALRCFGLEYYNSHDLISLGRNPREKEE